MDRAVELAACGPSWGGNPMVGCVILSPDGYAWGEGFHHGAGSAHAEIEALGNARDRGVDVRGGTAVVTLEPCRHTGRTGPCTTALAQAGIAKVVFAVADPSADAGGGRGVLAASGVTATHVPHQGAERLNHRWLTAARAGRPYVIVKWAQTLDGRIAAADGTSKWITGVEARAHVHGVRAHVDAILVGTGTVLADDPQLTARPAGESHPHQPLRTVMGMRDTASAQLWRDPHAVALRTHDPVVALQTLWKRGVRSVVVEGGGTVLSAFLTAGVVDEWNVYVAPILLGAGMAAVQDLGIATMDDALRGHEVTVTSLGADTLVAAFISRGL